MDETLGCFNIERGNFGCDGSPREVVGVVKVPGAAVGRVGNVAGRGRGDSEGACFD